jgi:hypothetical protein
MPEKNHVSKRAPVMPIPPQLLPSLQDMSLASLQRPQCLCRTCNDILHHSLSAGRALPSIRPLQCACARPVSSFLNMVSAEVDAQVHLRDNVGSSYADNQSLESSEYHQGLGEHQLQASG